MEVFLLDQLVVLLSTMVFLLLVMAQKMVKNTISSKTLGDHHGVLTVISRLELRKVMESAESKCNLLFLQPTEINKVILIKLIYPIYLIFSIDYDYKRKYFFWINL
jgi:hypothetical protein